MKTPFYLKILMMAMLSPVVFIGCAGDDGVVDDGDGDTLGNLPKWVRVANSTYADDDGSSVIYVVGIAKVGPDPSMTANMAENDGIVKMSRVLNTHVRTMFTSYARVAGDYYDEATLSAFRDTEQVSRSLSESFVSGLRPVNRYENENAHYVLMKLDLDNQLLERLNDSAKKYVRDRFAKKIKVQREEAVNKMDEASAALKKELAAAEYEPVPDMD